MLLWAQGAGSGELGRIALLLLAGFLCKNNDMVKTPITFHLDLGFWDLGMGTLSQLPNYNFLKIVDKYLYTRILILNPIKNGLNLLKYEQVSQ
jgi:hypothetical protein